MASISSTDVQILHNDARSAPIHRCASSDKTPTLSEFMRSAVPSLCSLQSAFIPSRLLPGGIIQTMYSSAGPSTAIRAVPYIRKSIMVPDGGNIALDFAPLTAFESAHEKTPVIIVLHGALGGSKASYVQAALEPLTRPKAQGGSGLRAVVFNFRGCNGTRLTSPRLYHPRMTDDLRSIILYLRSFLPDAPLYALGFSMGASLLSCYLAETGESSSISAAFCVSNVFDYMGCTAELDSGGFVSRRIFNPVIGLGHRKIVAANRDVFLSLENKKCSSLTLQQRKKAMSKVLWNPSITMSSFTADLIAPFDGYDGLSDFLEDTSCKSTLKDVRVPLVCLNALDDPLMKSDLLPYREAESSPYVMLALTPKGGHIGWYSRENGRITQWFVRPICEYFEGIAKLDFSARPSPTTLNVDASGIRQQAGRVNAGFREVSEAYIRSLDLKTRPQPTTSSHAIGTLLQGHFLTQFHRMLLSFVLVILAWHQPQIDLVSSSTSGPSILHDL